MPSLTPSTCPTTPPSGQRLPTTQSVSPSGVPTRHSHEARPYLCAEPGCFLRFKRKFTLSEHAKTHTGEKPHTCPVRSCGKSFTTSGNLSRHKRVHPWLKPQVCWVAGCGRTFSTEFKFERHIQRHLRPPNERHSCPALDCAKTFTTKGNLCRHLRQQHAADAGRVSLAVTPQLRRVVGAMAVPPSTDSVGCRPEFGSASAQILPEPTRGYQPFSSEISDVPDAELLDVLSCLF